MSIRVLVVLFVTGAASWGCVGAQPVPPESAPYGTALTASPAQPAGSTHAWKTEAARLYLAAATSLNDEYIAWGTDTQSMAAAANASQGTTEEKDHAFFAAWLPRNHALGDAFRAFASAVRSLPIPPGEGIASVESLAESANGLADYLAQFENGEEFVSKMGTVDSWLLHWYDATGAAQITAGRLRAELGLPSTEDGF